MDDRKVGRRAAFFERDRQSHAYNTPHPPEHWARKTRFRDIRLSDAGQIPTLCRVAFTFEHGQIITNDIMGISVWHTKCFDRACYG